MKCKNRLPTAGILLRGLGEDMHIEAVKARYDTVKGVEKTRFKNLVGKVIADIIQQE